MQTYSLLFFAKFDLSCQTNFAFPPLFKRPADIAVLIQAGRSVPGHVSAGVAGFGQGPDLGGDLIGAIGVVRLPDGVVALDPGAHGGRGGGLLLAAAGIIACASEEDIAALFRAAEAIREAGDNRHAAEAAFAFQHELAMQSGNTLLPLIFRSFYSSVLVLWERFCALNGVSMLYETSVRLCRHIRDRDLSAAVAWIDYCTRETVSGSRRIYY